MAPPRETADGAARGGVRALAPAEPTDDGMEDFSGNAEEKYWTKFLSENSWICVKMRSLNFSLGAGTHVEHSVETEK